MLENEQLLFIFKRNRVEGVAIRASEFALAESIAKNLEDDQWAFLRAEGLTGRFLGPGQMITPEDVDPNQPHIRVLWDKYYIATCDANYEATGYSGQLK